MVRKNVTRKFFTNNSFFKNTVFRIYNTTTHYIISNFTATFAQYQLFFIISIVPTLFKPGIFRTLVYSEPWHIQSPVEYLR